MRRLFALVLELVAAIESFRPTGVIPGLVGDPTTGLIRVAAGDISAVLEEPRLKCLEAWRSGGSTKAPLCAALMVKSESMLGRRAWLNLCHTHAAELGLKVVWCCRQAVRKHLRARKGAISLQRRKAPWLLA
ncbi:hypothetical protein Plhal304r1_c012g0045611 [Plasmopara halstedii]